MKFRRLIPLMALVLASGCARNAVLEVELTLPPRPESEPPLFAVVQFETDDPETGREAFERVWASGDAYPGVRLATETQLASYSVVSENSGRVLLVKVLFCSTDRCSAIEDDPDVVPAVWYRLERPFYVGQRTWWRHVIDTIPLERPSEPIPIDKCQIEGCIRAVTETTYCRHTGQHYCE